MISQLVNQLSRASVFYDVANVIDNLFLNNNSYNHDYKQSDKLLSKLRRSRVQEELSDSVVDLAHINSGYNLALNDSSVVNPFIISDELAEIIRWETRGCVDNDEKSKQIFEWIDNNIEYGRSGFFSAVNYRSSEEVLQERSGVCGEMAFLYVTMARSTGLVSNYVEVTRDNYWRKVTHGCASVDTNRRILVDPAYHIYDVKHVSYQVLSDSEAIRKFNDWR